MLGFFSLSISSCETEMVIDSTSSEVIGLAFQKVEREATPSLFENPDSPHRILKLFRSSKSLSHDIKCHSHSTHLTDAVFTLKILSLFPKYYPPQIRSRLLSHNCSQSRSIKFLTNTVLTRFLILSDTHEHGFSTKRSQFGPKISSTHT